MTTDTAKPDNRNVLILLGVVCGGVTLALGTAVVVMAGSWLAKPDPDSPEACALTLVKALGSGGIDELYELAPPTQRQRILKQAQLSGQLDFGPKMGPREIFARTLLNPSASVLPRKIAVKCSKVKVVGKDVEGNLAWIRLQGDDQEEGSVLLIREDGRWYVNF